MPSPGVVLANVLEHFAARNPLGCRGLSNCPTRQDAKCVLHVYEDKSLGFGALNPRDRALDHVPVRGRPCWARAAVLWPQHNNDKNFITHILCHNRSQRNGKRTANALCALKQAHSECVVRGKGTMAAWRICMSSIRARIAQAWFG
jgi:hypothetical protein